MDLISKLIDLIESNPEAVGITAFIANLFAMFIMVVPFVLILGVLIKMALSNGGKTVKERSKSIFFYKYLGELYSNKAHYLEYSDDDNELLNTIKSLDPNFDKDVFFNHVEIYVNYIFMAYNTDDYKLTDLFINKDVDLSHNSVNKYIKDYELVYLYKKKVQLIGRTVSDGRENITVYFNCLTRNGNAKHYLTIKIDLSRDINSKYERSATIKSNCPTCGSVSNITFLGTCEYCGNVIKADDAMWRIDSFELVK